MYFTGYTNRTWEKYYAASITPRTMSSIGHWVAQRTDSDEVTEVRKRLASIGSRPSDHNFRSVCLSVCLFVQSFSQPSLIRFRSD